MQHRIVSQGERDGAWEVVTRTAPPQLQWGLVSTWRWTAVDDAVVLELNVVPEGLFPEVLPRLGITFELPKVERVEWFGTGPNEAYVDTREAAAVGKYSATVAELQTPYVRPQENGHRIDTRWATLDGLRVEAIGTLFGLTVRDWTTDDLETAKHTADLVPGDTTYVTLDIAQIRRRHSRLRPRPPGPRQTQNRPGHPRPPLHHELDLGQSAVLGAG